MRLVIPITDRLPELFMEATLAHHASLSAQEEPELEPASQKPDESSAHCLGPHRQPGTGESSQFQSDKQGKSTRDHKGLFRFAHCVYAGLGVSLLVYPLVS